jgi:hypothetical protein
VDMVEGILEWERWGGVRGHFGAGEGDADGEGWGWELGR